MTDEKWASAYELFSEASQLPREQRRAFVENAPVGSDVISRVLELLDDPSSHEEDTLPEPFTRTGSKIGRYVVLDPLGRGGMGEVYFAQDTELDRIIALKFVSSEIPGAAALEHFLREAKAASALNHPNIVTIYEVAQSDDDLAIAMELVDGRAVSEYRSARVPAVQVAAWGRQIAQALAAAHARGIVHRDIKPENLMVRSDGYVKVLDFGLARKEPPAGWAAPGNISGLFGTLNYMSPEQTRGEPATAASDIFALGIVLFELATGMHPFLRDSPIDTADAIAHDKPDLLSGFETGAPSALVATILAMLAKDPRQRLTGEEVGRRLAVIGSAESPQWRVAPFRLKRTAIAAALVVVCAAFAWKRWTNSEPGFETARLVLRQITKQVHENRVTAASISPDGKTLAFAGFGEPIQLRRIRDGFSQTLATPEGLHVNRIAWFQDGTRLLVSGLVAGSAQSAIWALPVSGGPPVLVMEAGSDGVPAPDGSRIAFSSGNGDAVWVAGAAGRGAKQIRGGGTTGAFSSLIWSPDSQRISYQRQEQKPSLAAQVQGNPAQLEISNAYSFESVEAETGRVVASAQDFVMTSACALADGRVLFLRWKSFAETSTLQLWELQTDPRSGAILGPPKQLMSDPDATLSSVSASSDGESVAAIWSRDEPNIYVADLPSDQAPPRLVNVRRLSFALAFDFPHAWTPDSRAVIFESNRNGNYDLFRQSIDRREAEPLVVSASDKVLAQVSPDRKWLLYREGTPSSPTLMRTPLHGGPAKPIPTGSAAGEFRCGLQPGSRCVIRSIENDQFLFHELDPVHGKGRELARTVWSPIIMGDWDIAPDGSAVAIPNHSPRDARIRTVLLDPSQRELPETTVTLEGLQNLNGLVWTANGQGWFVCTRTPSGWSLGLVDKQGRSRELLHLADNTYAVPSPDGRRIAFPLKAVSRNVFLVEGLRSGPR